MRLNIEENIRNIRKQRGMTQEQLAEVLGVSIAAVSKWERGLATPDLSYIVEMAELFEVAVDALIGYEIQSGTCKGFEERIHKLQKEKKFDEAAIEAEKALARYPNNFQLVNRCSEMFELKGMETGDEKATERAIELMNRALLLLSQNTDVEINEYTIQAEIAQCYISLGQKEKGIELLKKCNVGGIYNAAIGLICSMSDFCSPEEAVPFLTRAFCESMASLIRVMYGYINYFVRIKDYESALDATCWIITYLESIKINGTVSFVDKFVSSFYAGCAHLSDMLGKEAESEKYLKKAICFARQFDANPSYNMQDIKFCVGEVKDEIVYESSGVTAMETIEHQSYEDNWSENLRATWQKLKGENLDETLE